MEVKLDKRFPVAAGAAQAWAVLSDLRATAACMPGAAITEKLDETHYKGTVKSRIGPAQMLFGGEVEVIALDPAGHVLELLARGADKAGSSAQMKLRAHLEAGSGGQGCVLVGAAVVGVNGKLAQFGSRLLVPVADAMLAQFADRFRGAAAAAMETAAAPAAAEPPADPGPGPASTAASTPTSTAPLPPAAVEARPDAPTPAGELKLLALAWAVVKGWFARRQGKRG